MEWPRCQIKIIKTFQTTITFTTLTTLTILCYFYLAYSEFLRDYLFSLHRAACKAIYVYTYSCTFTLFE